MKNQVNLAIIAYNVQIFIKSITIRPKIVNFVQLEIIARSVLLTN